MDAARELIQLKEKIESEKEKLARNEGKKEQIISQLRELGCCSVQEAEKEIDKLDKKIFKEEETYKKELKSFQKKYDI